MLVSWSISSDERIDIFAAAGLQKLDISILSDEFLEEVREVPEKKLAVEMLEKLLQRVAMRMGRMATWSDESLLRRSP